MCLLFTLIIFLMTPWITAAQTDTPVTPSPLTFTPTQIMIADWVRETLVAQPQLSFTELENLAITQVGIGKDDFRKAARFFNPAATIDTTSGLNDAQVFLAIRDALNQSPDTTLTDLRTRLDTAMNIPTAQFDRAARSLGRKMEARAGILVIGDSFIGGTARDDFTKALASATGLPVHNRAIGGQTIGEMAENLQADIQSAGGAPSIAAVVICGGLSDFRAHVQANFARARRSLPPRPYLEMVADFDRLVGMLAGQGIPVVISPIPMIAPGQMKTTLVPDPMYGTVAKRWPNVTIATGYSAIDILQSDPNLTTPDAAAITKLTQSLAGSIRAATAN